MNEDDSSVSVKMNLVDHKSGQFIVYLHHSVIFPLLLIN